MISVSVGLVRLALASLTMVVSVSSASVLTKLVSAPPSVIAFWRVTVALLIIVAYYLSVDRGVWPELRTSFRSLTLRYLASGTFLALHFYTWIWGLKLTRVYVSTTLVCLHPLITTALSATFLKEYVRPSVVVGMAVAITGSSLVAASVLDDGYSIDLTGASLSLVAAFLASAYVVLGRYVRVRTSRLGTYVIPTYTSTAIALLTLSLIEGSPISGIRRSDTLWLVALALGPMIGGHTLLNYLLKYVKASVASVPIVLEPVGASILASLILSEPVPPVGYVGVALAVIGLVVVTLRGLH